VTRGTSVPLADERVQSGFGLPISRRRMFAAGILAILFGTLRALP